MRKARYLLLAFVCFCPRSFSQTADACGAAVQHLALPDSLESRAYYLGQTLTPIRFGFSFQGIDVYMVAPPPPIVIGDIQVLVVYQDERLRQQVIEFLHGPLPGLTLVSNEGSLRRLNDLKFADLVFACNESPFFPARGKMVWQGSRKCILQRILYYEPKECIVLPEHPDIYQMQQLSMAGVIHRGDAMNPMNWLTTLERVKDVRLYDDSRFPGGHELLMKILQAIRTERDEQVNHSTR
jgi:hypothetical protein